MSYIVQMSFSFTARYGDGSPTRHTTNAHLIREARR